jgi:hypothetical protein
MPGEQAWCHRTTPGAASSPSDPSTPPSERHYTHLAPNYVADTIRASFPRLTETQAQTVVPIARGRRNRRQARM